MSTAIPSSNLSNHLNCGVPVISSYYARARAFLLPIVLCTTAVARCSNTPRTRQDDSAADNTREKYQSLTLRKFNTLNKPFPPAQSIVFHIFLNRKVFFPPKNIRRDIQNSIRYTA